MALEGGALRLIRRAFCNDACYIYHVWNAEPVWQSGGGRLNKSWLYECAIFPGYLFTVMMSHVGVVTPTNTAMPELSPYKNLKSKSWNSFVNMTRNITLKLQLKFCGTSGSQALMHLSELKCFVDRGRHATNISGPWRSSDPRPSPDLSPWLQDKIWEWPGDEAICDPLRVNPALPANIEFELKVILSVRRHYNLL